MKCKSRIDGSCEAPDTVGCGHVNNTHECFKESPILPTNEDIISTIIENVFIRGIDLEDYKKEFSEERSGLPSAIRKLFNK